MLKKLNSEQSLNINKEQSSIIMALRQSEKGVFSLDSDINRVTNICHEDKVLHNRIEPQRMLPEGTTVFVKSVIDINDIQLGVLCNDAPDISVEDLKRLRVSLIEKYSMAKTSIEHSMIRYSRVVQDYQDLTNLLSDSTISKKREELTTILFTAKKCINELSKKKKEIEEINNYIGNFSGEVKVEFKEDELIKHFGDYSDKVKESLVQTGTGDDAVYSLNADVSRPVPELVQLQQHLQHSVDEYTLSIKALTESYKEKVAKFNAIKRIMGIEDEPMADADQQVDDVELVGINDDDEQVIESGSDLDDEKITETSGEGDDDIAGDSD